MSAIIMYFGRITISVINNPFKTILTKKQFYVYTLNFQQYDRKKSTPKLVAKGCSRKEPQEINLNSYLATLNLMKL